MSPELQLCCFDHGFLFVGQGRGATVVSRAPGSTHRAGPFMIVGAAGGGWVGAGRALTARQALITSWV